MSTLTKLSATPYTGPAPTNREPYVPANAEAADARGAEIAVKAPHSAMAQELGQDLPTFIVEKDAIVDVLRALHDHHDFGFTLPLDLFGADYPNRQKRFDSSISSIRSRTTSASASKSASPRVSPFRRARKCFKPTTGSSAKRSTCTA